MYVYVYVYMYVYVHVHVCLDSYMWSGVWCGVVYRVWYVHTIRRILYLQEQWHNDDINVTHTQNTYMYNTISHYRSSLQVITTGRHCAPHPLVHLLLTSVSPSHHNHDALTLLYCVKLTHLTQ